MLSQSMWKAMRCKQPSMVMHPSPTIRGRTRQPRTPKPRLVRRQASKAHHFPQRRLRFVSTQPETEAVLLCTPHCPLRRQHLTRTLKSDENGVLGLRSARKTLVQKQSAPLVKQSFYELLQILSLNRSSQTYIAVVHISEQQARHDSRCARFVSQPGRHSLY